MFETVCSFQELGYALEHLKNLEVGHLYFINTFQFGLLNISPDNVLGREVSLSISFSIRRVALRSK